MTVWHTRGTRNPSNLRKTSGVARVTVCQKVINQNHRHFHESSHFIRLLHARVKTHVLGNNQEVRLSEAIYSDPCRHLQQPGLPNAMLIDM